MHRKERKLCKTSFSGYKNIEIKKNYCVINNQNETNRGIVIC